MNAKSTLGASPADGRRVHSIAASYLGRWITWRRGIIGCGRGLLLFVTIAQTGCVGAFDGYLIRRDAELRFSNSNACPRDRLSVDRVAIEPRDILEPARPPPEIAADPERLRVWKNTSDGALARLMAVSAVEVAGCGVRTTYVCWQEWSSGDDQAEHLVQQCYDVDFKERSTRTLGHFQVKPNLRELLENRLDRSEH